LHNLKQKLETKSPLTLEEWLKIAQSGKVLVKVQSLGKKQAAQNQQSKWMVCFLLPIQQFNRNVFPVCRVAHDISLCPKETSLLKKERNETRSYLADMGAQNSLKRSLQINDDADEESSQAFTGFVICFTQMSTIQQVQPQSFRELLDSFFQQDKMI
jgi:hypothetical protein